MTVTPAVRKIVVPASSANLGPGLDTLAVALKLYLRVTIVDVDETTPDHVTATFASGTFAGENRIDTAFRLARSRIGVPVPGVRIDVRSDIPMRAGLGSSAAAAVAGLKLYEAMTTARPAGEWLALATEIEGHPDNAAAALLGGLAASCQLDSGAIEAQSWNWPASVALVVVTPDVPLETRIARGVLPATVPFKDAVFNLQRVVRFIRALESGRLDELREAMRDRWHQPFRASLVPAMAEMLALEHPALLGTCLSGAGPSMLALAKAEAADEVAAAVRQLYDQLDVRHTVRTLGAHPTNDFE
jgi:homoserine kinase